MFTIQTFTVRSPEGVKGMMRLVRRMVELGRVKLVDVCGESKQGCTEFDIVYYSTLEMLKTSED